MDGKGGGGDKGSPSKANGPALPCVVAEEGAMRPGLSSDATDSAEPHEGRYMLLVLLQDTHATAGLPPPPPPPPPNHARSPPLTPPPTIPHLCSAASWSALSAECTWPCVSRDCRTAVSCSVRAASSSRTLDSSAWASGAVRCGAAFGLALALALALAMALA